MKKLITPSPASRTIIRPHSTTSPEHLLEDAENIDVSTESAEEAKPQKVRRAEDSLADRLIWFFIFQLPVLLLIFYAGIYYTGRYVLSDGSIGDHGQTLNEFIASARNEPYEIHATFSSGGTKYYEATQYDDSQVAHDQSIDKISWLISLGNYTSVHTHPDDVPFSVTDLMGIADSSVQASKRMVISPNYIYTLEAPNGWPNESVLTQYLAQVRLDIDNRAEYTQRMFSLSVFKGGYIGVATTNLFLEHFASDFDLVYTVMTIEEWMES